MHKRRWKMSLASFLLFVGIIGLACSHFLTSWELTAVRKELRNYRSQYGQLVVKDPTRSHALAYANLANPWKWHVSFPSGREYKLMCGLGAVPTTGIPNVSDLKYVRETPVMGTGKSQTIFVSATEYGADSLKLTIGCDGTQTVSQIIPKSEVYTRSVFSQWSVGKGETFDAAGDESFVIFYRTEQTATPATPPRDVKHGIIVWAVPVN